MWTYIESESGLFIVGFYGPDSVWHVISKHHIKLDALKVVAFLNGETGDRL